MTVFGHSVASLRLENLIESQYGQIDSFALMPDRAAISLSKLARSLDLRGSVPLWSVNSK
jgi:hypothetical protein